MTPQPLGQNFLADAGWRERIAHLVLASASSRAATQPGAGEASNGGLWIEIGAGHGEITSFLAAQASHVIAIELDDNLLPGLRELATRLGNVTVVSGDILTQDLAEL